MAKNLKRQKLTPSDRSRPDNRLSELVRLLARNTAKEIIAQQANPTRSPRQSGNPKLSK